MDDFDKFLDEARAKQPTTFQMRKWKKTIESMEKKSQNNRPRQSHAKFWGQMSAAVLIGVVVGGLLFGDFTKDDSENNQNLAYEDATIEVIYTKL